MKKTPLLTALALAALTCATGVANSANVTLENVTASWINSDPVAGVAITGNGTTAPRARWGDPATNDGQSGYNFDVAGQPILFVVPPSPSANNVIGTFTHLNFPIYPPSLESITLRMTADVKVDGSLVGDDLNFNYGFSHWETENGQKPTCANGEAWGTGVNSNGCADRVIASWLASSASFDIETSPGVIDTYTVNVLGFSRDAAGTNPFTEFWTKESESNVAYLVGNVTLKSALLPPDQVPEPATLALVGAALAGLAASRRRKSGRA